MKTAVALIQLAVLAVYAVKYSSADEELGNCRIPKIQQDDNGMSPTCAELKKQSESMNSGMMIKPYTPNCVEGTDGEDSSFESKHCDGSTGYCCCVNPKTGQPLDGEENMRGPTEKDKTLKCD